MYCTCAQVIYNVLYTHTRCITSDGGGERVNKFSDERGRRHLPPCGVFLKNNDLEDKRIPRDEGGGGGGGGGGG